MLQDQKLAENIFNLMNTIIEGLELSIDYLHDNKYYLVSTLLSDCQNGYDSLLSFKKELAAQESDCNFAAALDSCLVSLYRIVALLKTDLQKAAQKIEFELLPLTEEMRGLFYYWMMVHPDPEKIKQYYATEQSMLFYNRYLAESQRTGIYPYELSIRVIGYNKLKYTKMCIDSLLSHLPKKISYELIFINHGSSDGTKEYFESKHPDKQMDIEINGKLAAASLRIVQGRYLITISNDIIITEQVLNHMYACLNSDPQIGWAVPTTPNTSNLQSIPLEYNNIEKLHEAAKNNNIQDPFRWEQRVRLVNPIQIYSMETYFKLAIPGDFKFAGIKAFPDDKMSAIFRRNGYKMMLLKDSFCHHFGQISLKEELNQPACNDIYSQGRIKFKEIYGIDPWDYSMCYERKLFKYLPCIHDGHVSILGLNCGLGSNPLKIKEQIKEFCHNKNVTIYNYTDDKSFLQDLKGVSDYAKWGESIEYLIDKPIYYDYIIFERNIEHYSNYKEIIKKLFSSLNSGGWIMVRTSTIEIQNWLKKHFKKQIIIQESQDLGITPISFWYLWTK